MPYSAHRTRRRFASRFAWAAVALCALLTGPAPAQVGLAPCGGALGKPTRYELSGGTPNTFFLMLTSVQRGFLPLSLVDPGDTRSLRVGLESLGLNVVGALDAGGNATFSLPIPNLAPLKGLALLHQVLTFPGKGRTFDGVTDVSVLLLDQAGAFQAQTAAMRETRAFHTILSLGDGRHLVVGGGDTSTLWLQARRTTEIYDEATRTFVPGPSMTTERGLHTQTRLADGRYLLVGGVDKLIQAQNTAEIFDPGTGKWTQAAPMTTKRMGHTASLLPGGRVLVAGGVPADILSVTNTTEIYDPKTNQWTAGPNMTAPRAVHCAIPIDSYRVLLAGGLSWRSIIFVGKVPEITGRCDVYDSRTNKITAVGSMRTARLLFAAGRLANGKILAAGGLSGNLLISGGATVGSAEIFDPVSNSWSATSSMTNNRALASSIVLRDGRFAVFGGAIGDIYTPIPIKASEAYDPKTSSWSKLPDLTVPRAAGVVVELRSCGIMVFGGGSTGANAPAIASHELLLR